MNLQTRLAQLERAIKPQPNARPFEHLTDQQLDALLDDEVLEAMRQDPTKQHLYDELQHTLKTNEVKR